MREMKNFGKRLILFVVLFGTSNLIAQEEKNVIKANVISPLFGQYQLAYERVLIPELSVQLSAGILSGKNEGNTLISGTEYSYENKRSGFIAIPEVRYYPWGRAPKNFFISGFGRLHMANNKLTDQGSGTTGIEQSLSRERVVTTIGGGSALGFQWISSGGFSFDIFAGAHYKSRSVKTTYETAALNNASTNSDFDSVGDELFNQKYINFSLDDKSGWRLRFGFHFGYAF